MNQLPWHIPVLATATLREMALQPTSVVVDCTTGGGGHSAMILEQLGEGGTLICFDKDSDSFDEALPKLERLAEERQVTLMPIRSDFRHLEAVLEERGVDGVDRVLADIGVSSHQLDDPERGFSYMNDGPLDMRMNPDEGAPASELVNHASEEALRQIIKNYGEERYSGRIASAIVKRRVTQAFTRTLDLVEVIRQAMPASARYEAQHPAKRTFQALRMAVNGELDALEALLDQAPRVIRHGGRLQVITFHSLEDRPVKQAMRRWEQPCECPTNRPCVCGLKPLGAALRRSGTTADPVELEQNPRARSSRLRTFIFDGDGHPPADSFMISMR